MDSLDVRLQVERTRWGNYVVISNTKFDNYETKLKLLNIDAGKNISYQYHNYRGETWSVLSGDGMLIIDGVSYDLKEGMSLNIPKYTWHSVKAGKNILTIAEVQAGEKCEESDIIRKYYSWDDIVRFAGEDD